MPPLSLNRPAAGRLPLETLNNSTRWKIWEPYELDKKHPILAMIKQERGREIERVYRVITVKLFKPVTRYMHSAMRSVLIRDKYVQLKCVLLHG